MVDIKCPYCKAEFQYSHDGHFDFDVECPGCNDEFEVHIDWYPHVTSDKIIYEECPRCKKEKRYVSIYAGYGKLCDECHTESIVEDLKNNGSLDHIKIIED